MAVAPQQTAAGAAAKVERAAAKAHPWVEPVARLGYIAKGLVYLLIGALALLAAWNVHIGQRGDEMNQQGVINFIARQTFGTILLIAIAVGLAGYSLWRLTCAILNPENKAVLKRLAYAFSALAYGSLGYAAMKAVFGARERPDEKRVARTLADQPFGSELMFVIGAIVLVVAIGQVWNACCGDVICEFKEGEMKPWQRKAAIWLGRIGLSARAVLFGLVGGFFIAAGAKHQVSSAGGFTDALRTLQGSIGGNWLLAADCIGLVCFGLYAFMQARFRDIKLADEQLIEQVNGSKA